MHTCEYCNQPSEELEEYASCSNCNSEDVLTTQIASYYGKLELRKRPDGFFITIDSHSSTNYTKISEELYNMMVGELCVK